MWTQIDTQRAARDKLRTHLFEFLGIASEDHRQARLSRRIQLGKPQDVAKDLGGGRCGIVQEQDRGAPQPAVLGQMIAHPPPEPAKRLTGRWTGAQLCGHLPEELVGVDSPQGYQGHLGPRARQGLSKGTQQPRLATAAAAQDQAKPTAVLDEKMEPGQGLLLTWSAVKPVRIERTGKRQSIRIPR